MRLTFCLTICLAQILLNSNAMEEDQIEFFTIVRLPFSVKRGEIINVPLTVHNVVHYEIQAAITLENSNAEYEKIDFENKVISERKLTKSIRVRAKENATVSFLIRPKVIGKIMLIFKVSSVGDFYINHQIMNVVPEGITQYGIQAFLVNLKKEPEHKSEFELVLPENLVPYSQHVEVGVVGDIMGLALKNLDYLVPLSTDCGKPTSLLLNYLVMKYLKNTKRLTPYMEARLRHNLETGYQNLLNCGNIDGSFSNFGPYPQNDSTFMMAYVSVLISYFKVLMSSISSGSFLANGKPRNSPTWLTACILRFLPHIKEFVNVNETVIEEGLAYLSKQQAQNGTFTERGAYLYPSKRNHITLTTAAVLAFLENHAYADKYLRNITKGLEFIDKNIEKSKSLHIQSLSTYSSNNTKHVASEQISIIKWLPETNLANQSKWWHYVLLSDDEINSYNLLMLLNLNTNKIDNRAPIVKRLIVQRKSFAGFASDQEAVVCLTALIKFADFADYADYKPAEMDVNILSKHKNETVKLTEDTGILYKRVKLPPKTKSFKIAAKGNGSALVQITYQYNVFKDQKDLYPGFTIKTIKFDNKKKSSDLKMLVCVNSVDEGKSSNMAMLEIYTPTGYIIYDECLKEIRKLKRIINMKLLNSGSLLAVHFHHLYKTVPTCLMVEAFRAHDVAMQKPAPILIYDYYNEDRRAIAFYEVDAKLCDVCGTPEECSKCK